MPKIKEAPLDLGKQEPTFAELRAALDDPFVEAGAPAGLPAGLRGALARLAGLRSCPRWA